MNLSTVEVGYLPKCTSTKGGTNVPLLELLEDIRNGKWREPVEALRGLPPGSKEYGKAKKRLHCIMLSATTLNGTRRQTGIGEHTGIIQADVDKLGGCEAVELWEKLASDPHILATWLSPGGEGVKAAVCVEASKEKHSQSFEAVRQHFLDVHGAGIDAQCKDISRLCFVSYDPNLRLNQRAVLLPTAGRSRSGQGLEVTALSPPSYSSTVLRSKDYSLHLHNNSSQPLAVWSDYPLLEPLYKRLVTARLGEPHKGTRNQTVVEIASLLYSAMSRQMMLVCVEAYWRQYQDVFSDYPLSTFLNQAESVWKGCEGSYCKQVAFDR